MPKSAQPWVATLIRTIFDQPDTDAVKAQYARVLDTIAERFPDAAEHLDAAHDDLLAFTAFPRELWRQIWSNNPQERLNKEIRRRTDVLHHASGRDLALSVMSVRWPGCRARRSGRRRGAGIRRKCRVRAGPRQGRVRVDRQRGFRTTKAVPAPTSRCSVPSKCRVTARFGKLTDLSVTADPSRTGWGQNVASWSNSGEPSRRSRWMTKSRCRRKLPG